MLSRGVHRSQEPLVEHTQALSIQHITAPQATNAAPACLTHPDPCLCCAVPCHAVPCCAVSQMDSRRNHIIMVNLWLSMLNISVMATTVLPAMFGMNLDSGLAPDDATNWFLVRQQRDSLGSGIHMTRCLRWQIVLAGARAHAVQYSTLSLWIDGCTSTTVWPSCMTAHTL